MKNNRLAITYSLFSLGLLLPKLVIAAPAQFQVDVIIFQHQLNQATPSTETWPHLAPIKLPIEAITLAPQTTTVEAPDASDDTIGNEQETLANYTCLSPEQILLKHEQKRLNSSEQIQTLWHQSWLQPMHRSKMIAIHSSIDGPDHVDGTIMIAKHRYYQVALDLDLTQSGQHYRLIETRKIQDDKLQYFDHPKFGALLVIHQLSNEQK